MLVNYFWIISVQRSESMQIQRKSLNYISLSTLHLEREDTCINKTNPIVDNLQNSYNLLLTKSNPAHFKILFKTKFPYKP